MKRTLAALTGAVIVAAFGIAQAKSIPYVEGDTDWGSIDAPLTINKPRSSVTFDGSLNSPDDVDAFGYSFSAPVKGFPLQVDVPTCPGSSNAAFYPTVALVGPGLPAPDAEVKLPFDVPDGMGVQTFTIEHARVKRYSYAGYGPETYVIGLRKNIDIPAAGAYTLVVWEPDGHVGPYVVSTGDQEPDFAGLTDDQISQMFAQASDSQWIADACATTSAEAPATPEATARSN